jgi:3-hydroxyisobutyrate dehydrogenase-like beta-hydroxyacid dehydrogenase
MTGKGTTVACIGLGRMGAGIAGSIQQAGFGLRVYNRTAAKMQPLAERGATASSSPREAAAGAKVVVTNLMDDASVLEAVTGAEGILAGLAPGGIHVDTTTISPRCARRLAELHRGGGSRFLAGPVLGRPDVAARGELRTFLAGDAGAMKECRPVVDAYTSLVIDLGEDPGVASSMKLAVNYMLAATVELMGQVFAFGEKSGISPDMLALVMGAFYGQPALQEYARLIRSRSFGDPGFTLAGALKDAELMLEAAGDVRAPLPFGGIVRDKMLCAAARGMEDLDWAAISEISRIQAGLG